MTLSQPSMPTATGSSIATCRRPKLSRHHHDLIRKPDQEPQSNNAGPWRSQWHCTAGAAGRPIARKQLAVSADCRSSVHRKIFIAAATFATSVCCCRTSVALHGTSALELTQTQPLVEQPCSCWLESAPQEAVFQAKTLDEVRS